MKMTRKKQLTCCSNTYIYRSRLFENRANSSSIARALTFRLAITSTYAVDTHTNMERELRN